MSRALPQAQPRWVNPEPQSVAFAATANGKAAGDDALLRQIAPLVAAAFAVPASVIYARTRGAPAAALARQCAIYLAHTVLGLTYGAAGRLFGRDRTTASHACRRIEDWRDDPEADARVAALERRFSDLICGGQLSAGHGCAQRLRSGVRR